MTLTERVQLLRAREQVAAMRGWPLHDPDSWDYRPRARLGRVRLPPRTCRALGCGRLAIRKYGLCHMHAMRWLRTGDVEGQRAVSKGANL